MRIPGQQDLKELRGRYAAYYSCWVARGLMKYSIQAQGRRSFPGAEHFIDQQDSIESDLWEIAKALDADDLKDFQHGCVAAFQTLDLTCKEDTIIGKQLLRLCAFIQAKGILGVLDERKAEIKKAEPTEQLYYLAKEVIRDLA